MFNIVLLEYKRGNISYIHTSSIAEPSSKLAGCIVSDKLQSNCQGGINDTNLNKKFKDGDLAAMFDCKSKQ